MGMCRGKAAAERSITMFTGNTPHAVWRRAWLTLTATSAALSAVTVPAAAASAQGHKDGSYPITVDGGNAFPESVAADSDYLYTASIDDGTVYRGRLGAKTMLAV